MASRVEGLGWLAVFFAVLVWILCAVPLSAQAAVPATADAVIEEMARASGVIFAGRVVAVRRPFEYMGSSTLAPEGVVEVDFLVDQAVRGPASGTIYTLREWPGLWSAGSERYRVGQRLLVFFYPPDAHGLSSPVHGRDGAVPIRGSGVAPGPDDATNAAAEWMVDLRWVQTQALRRAWRLMLPVPEPVLPKPIHGITPEAHVGLNEAEVDPGLVRRVPTASPISVAAQIQPLAQVIALCQQAVESSHALR